MSASDTPRGACRQMGLRFRDDWIDDDFFLCEEEKYLPQCGPVYLYHKDNARNRWRLVGWADPSKIGWNVYIELPNRKDYEHIGDMYLFDMVLFNLWENRHIANRKQEE